MPDLLDPLEEVLISTKKRTPTCKPISTYYSTLIKKHFGHKDLMAQDPQFHSV